MREMSEEVIPKPILIEGLGYLYPKEGSKQRRRYSIYKCGLCGTNFKAGTSNISTGNTKSCGCYHKKKVKESKTKHGFRYTRLYSIWRNMKERILNPNYKKYNDYGGRGITICDEWLDVQNFYDWAITNGYSDELSIDRIDTNGNYEPNNCRWVGDTIQARNKRIRKDNTSGYKGVSYFKDRNKYKAVITINKEKIHLGLFPTAVEGAIAYNNYIIENNLEGFILNEIPKDYLNKISKEEA